MNVCKSPALRTIYSHRVVLKRCAAVVFAILVLGMLAFAVFKVDWAAVIVALKALPASALWWAALVATLTYFIYSCFDLLGRYYTGHHLTWWRCMLVGVISYAFTMNLGSTIGGVGLRIRLYAKQGLRQGDILRIWAISVMTNWTGYLLMLAMVLVSGNVAIPQSWGAGSRVVSLLGFIGLGVVVVYLLASAFSSRRSWEIRGHMIELPQFKIAITQAVLGALLWATIAIIPYILFQDRVPYLQVLGIVLISAVAGLAARVPGGIGVVEYVFMTVLSATIPRNETLAVVLVYRLFYYIAPLMVAGLCYLLAEAGLKSISRRPV